MNEEFYPPSEVAAKPKTNAITAAASVESDRAVAEVKASMILAKQFPRRDTDDILKDVIKECGRLSFAESALYTYPRGTTRVSGASVRLAESIAMKWGNIKSGWRELSRTTINGVQVCELEAYVWDIETNYRKDMHWQIKLIRNTRNGSYPLTDERDIYEMCANSAARRERSLVLKAFPSYIVEDAENACRETIRKSITPETIPNMVKAFERSFGVSQTQILAYCNCKSINDIEPFQVVNLRGIHQSIKDGMGKPDQWFKGWTAKQSATGDEETPAQNNSAALNDKLKGKKKAEETPAAPPHDPETGEVKEQTPFADPAPTAEPEAADPYYSMKPEDMPVVSIGDMEKKGEELVRRLKAGADKELLWQSFQAEKMIDTLVKFNKGGLVTRIMEA